MMAKAGRIAPRIDLDRLEENFCSQLTTGSVYDARYTGSLPPLHSARGQRVALMGCALEQVSLADAEARGLLLSDVRIVHSDLANMKGTGCTFERVEILETRLTGANFSEARWKSVLFRECRLDLCMLRMAVTEHCVFENCVFAQADFYGADLRGAVFRASNLAQADLGACRLAGVDLRNCRLDGVRGKPADMDGLTISPDQASLLIALFGIRVAP